MRGWECVEFADVGKGKYLVMLQEGRRSSVEKVYECFLPGGVQTIVPLQIYRKESIG